MPTPLTEHKAVSLQVSLSLHAAQARRSCYQKRNNSLLKHETGIEDILVLIKCFWDKSLASHVYCQNWELFKFEAAKYLSMAFQQQNKGKLKELMQLQGQLLQNRSEDDEIDFVLQQNKLNDIYKLNAGGFMRSRRQMVVRRRQTTLILFWPLCSECYLNNVQKC